jgi:Sec-independent protein translocase protein TatA
MQIGWGQLLFIGFLVFLLFGNLPKLVKDLTLGFQELKKTQKGKFLSSSQAFFQEKHNEKKQEVQKEDTMKKKNVQ